MEYVNIGELSFTVLHISSETEESTPSSGAVYDSDSEFDDNGDDLEGAATSPHRPPQSQDPSELSFIDRDEYSGRDLDSFADDNGLADEGSQDSGEDTQTPAAGSEGEGEGEIDEERPQQSTSRRRLGGAGSRRKISRFGYDSEDDDGDAGDLEEDSEFFVDDDQIEHMDPSDGLLDDEEEAEETDREERRARREERRQAKLARRLRPVEDEDSTSSYASEEDDDESSSEEDDPGLQQSASLTSPSVKGENDVDIPTISSQQVRKEMQEQARRKEATASARDKAARAAISRNARQGQAPDDQRNKASASSSEHAIRRKRIIEASDEE